MHEKRILKAAMAVLVCAAVAAFVCPRSVERKLNRADEVLIKAGGGFSDKEVKEVTIRKESEAFEELKQIVKPYTYHPTFATLIRHTTATGSIRDDVTIYMFDESGKQFFNVHALGKQKTWIDDTSYHMGYGGDETAQRFAEDISAFAERHAADGTENNS